MSCPTALLRGTHAGVQTHARDSATYESRLLLSLVAITTDQTAQATLSSSSMTKTDAMRHCIQTLQPEETPSLLCAQANGKHSTPGGQVPQSNGKGNAVPVGASEDGLEEGDFEVPASGRTVEVQEAER